MMRDHDNIIRNLRQEVNLLKEKSDQHEKYQAMIRKDIDAFKDHNEDQHKQSKVVSCLFYPSVW